MTRLTKQQLFAQIAKLESELGMREQTLAQMEADYEEAQRTVRAQRLELDALYTQQRPSRSSTDFPDTVVVQRVSPTATVAYRERCARAKELAMKSGRAVRIAL